MSKEYLTDLFIKEAKPALDRHSGGESNRKSIVDFLNARGCMRLFQQQPHESFEGMLEFNDTADVTIMDAMFIISASVKSAPLLNTTNVISMVQMFYGCSALESVPLYDTKNVLYTSMMLQDNVKLKVVPAWDLRSLEIATNMFSGCSSLTECWVRNIKTNFQVASGTAYGHLLTVESLISLIKELRDTGSMKTLTIGSENLNKLANVYVRVITTTDDMRAEDDLIDEKLPFEVCESTDAGATLITEYVKFKNWQIL